MTPPEADPGGPPAATRAGLLYDGWLLHVPELMDVAALYGGANPGLTRKFLEQVGAGRGVCENVCVGMCVCVCVGGGSCVQCVEGALQVPPGFAPPLAFSCGGALPPKPPCLWPLSTVLAESRALPPHRSSYSVHYRIDIMYDGWALGRGAWCAHGFWVGTQATQKPAGQVALHIVRDERLRPLPPPPPHTHTQVFALQPRYWDDLAAAAPLLAGNLAEVKEGVCACEGYIH